MKGILLFCVVASICSAVALRLIAEDELAYVEPESVLNSMGGYEGLIVEIRSLGLPDVGYARLSLVLDQAPSIDTMAIEQIVDTTTALDVLLQRRRLELLVFNSNQPLMEVEVTRSKGNEISVTNANLVLH